MINIVNKYHNPDPMIPQMYCGRGSPLGNPFKLLRPKDRDSVCDQYEEYFQNAVYVLKDSTMLRYLDRIAQLAKKGDVNLVCYCAPKRCHCETIKKYVETNYEL